MYLMSYFRSEAEALHLALSDDGLNWQPLNENRPVLYGSIGSRTLRDPFLVQAQDGLFHLLATDGWFGASIIHASSTDLVHWSAQRAVPVMAAVPTAHNAWAPECFYDQEHDLYRVHWSSSMRGGGSDEDWDHRIWAATTTDFDHYGPAELFFDPGFSVIDATVAHQNGAYLMAFKDERGENRKGTEHKAIRVCTSVDGLRFTDISGLVTPSLVEGPTLLRHQDRWIMLYDYFEEACYGASTSDDGRNWSVYSGPARFPPGARHGSVCVIDDVLAEQCRRARW